MQHFSVPADTPKVRLDLWLHRTMNGPSRTGIQKWIRSGRVTIDGNPATPGARVSPGLTISVLAEETPEETLPRPADLPLEILMEDPGFVVINKRAGQVVHPAPGHRGDTVLNAMLHHYPDMNEAGPADRPGVVHRLDADTSGVLIFARTPADLDHLQHQFRERTTGKTYRCICRGIPNPVTQEIKAPIGRHPVHRQKRAVNGSAAKDAFTSFRMLRGLARGTAAELDVRIKTGRTHQIRVHLDSIGHPVLGDPLYGGRRTTLPPPWPTAPRLLLHAASLRFTHPRTGESVQVDAPLPADYLIYCEQLSSS